MNNTTGLQHIGIPCRNIKDTVEFYEKLGFTNVYETTNNNKPVCFVELGGLMLELYQDVIVEKTGAINHFCLNVTDIETAFKEAVDMKLSMCDSNINFLPFWSNGVRFFTILGPNAERIEFCQKL